MFKSIKTGKKDPTNLPSIVTISDSISIKEGNSTFSTTSLLPLPQQQPLLQLLLLLSYYFYQAAQYAVQYFYILLLVYVVILLLVILSFDKLDSYLPPQHLHLSPTISTTTTPTTFTCFACDSTTTSATSSTSNFNFSRFYDQSFHSFHTVIIHQLSKKQTKKKENYFAPIVLPIVIMSPEDRQRKLFVSTVSEFALIYACIVPILSFQHQHEHENLLMHEDR